MKEKALSALKHLGWGIRLGLAVLAILPILLFMVWFNYTVDRSGLFQGDVTVREVAAQLLSGHDLSGYEKMDDRALAKLVVQQMETAPNTVALGSSRILQMTGAVAGTNDFFNFGMVGADFYDVLGTFYLFVQEDKLPQNVIIGLDPWLLNDSADATDFRSDKNMYAEFLSLCLGEDADYEIADETAKWEALISPSYFQGNWEYYNRDKSTETAFASVSGSAYANNLSEIKNSDGSVHYTAAMRNQSIADIANSAVEQAGTFLHCIDYEAPSTVRVRLLGKYIKYMQSLGINVYIVLTPYHPYMYEYALTYPDRFTGFLRTESIVRRLAAKYEVPVYGSYSPYLLDSVDAADFYDGLHCTPTCIAKFWPGIHQAAANAADGINPADALTDTVDNHIYAELLLRCGEKVARELEKSLPLTVTESAPKTTEKSKA